MQGYSPISGGGGVVRGGHAHPIVETRRKIVKVVDGGGGEDLKCCRPEKILVCRKNFWFVGKIFRFVGKELPLPPPPKKKHGTHGATVTNAEYRGEYPIHRHSGE